MNHLKDCIKNLSILVLFKIILIGITIGAVNISWAEDWAKLRANMVSKQMKARDITDPEVLKVMGEVPRHMFVPKYVQRYAYSDRPLPIGEGQTISQPYIVALMSQLLDLKGGMKVLEIGTGSGYQAAVLSALGAQTYSIEIIPKLSMQAKERLKKLGYPAALKNADGYYGWKLYAPFDRIIITAAANHIPRPLVDQLKPGGKMILPLGNTQYYQTLTLVHLKKDGKTDVSYYSDVRFVPMTGEVQK
jgi:protein-L-isoaspartate(D-aspartate) O-methyltransferase